jgi:Phosphoglycerate dehydrogenase and related dehydrogenases
MRKIVFGFSDEFQMPEDIMNQIKNDGKDTFVFSEAGSESDPEQLKDTEAFIGWPSDKQLQLMPRLKWLQLPSAGVNQFAHHPLIAEQVVITNASGVFGVPGAEHIMALMLAFVRELPLYVRQSEKHIWKAGTKVRQLEGASVAIIGLGDIGTEAAKRLKAFGAHVLGVKRTLGRKPDFVDKLVTMENLNTVLNQSDFVVNVLPLTEETKGVFDRRQFAQMKTGAIFINVGRGDTVDESALIDALKSEKLAGAGLDVTSAEPLPETNELWNFENVLITSHSLGVSPGKLRKRAALIRENIARYRTGKELINPVDRKLGY